MTQHNLEFAGSNPEHYDRHLGPVLFEPYAADLAHRVGLAVHHGTVVELACGTGILTRHLREALPPTVSLVATDVSAAMVRYAEAAIRVEGIGWRTADAMDLPFEAGFATAIVCQFGLMFVPDKPRAVREMQRVLTADGRIWVSVWDSLGANPVAAVANAALAKAVGTSPPVPFFNIPHGLSDTDALLQLFEENGFTDVQIELVSARCNQRLGRIDRTRLRLRHAAHLHPRGARRRSRRHRCRDGGGVARRGGRSTVPIAIESLASDRPTRHRLEAIS